MKVNSCDFPENLAYDEDFKIWFKKEELFFKLGITSAYSWYIGKINRIRFIRDNGIIEKNKNLCIIESDKKIEAIRLPFTFKIVNVNTYATINTKIVNNNCYDEGWLAIIQPIEDTSRYMYNCDEDKIREKINFYNIKCFKMIPDIYLYEIGTECSAVIAKLNEMFSRLNYNDVVLIVSDDPTAYVEMVRWTDQTKNKLIDYRKENDLWFFLIKK